MESVLETSNNPADRGLYEVTVFTKRILRIDSIPHAHEHNYLQESTFFSYVTVEEAIHSLQNNEVVDAILLHGNAVVSDITPLTDIARQKAVPVILYTTKFEKTAKIKALNYNADDYLYGAITNVFLKRIDALKKLKTYKKERGNRPYETFSEEAPRYEQRALKRAIDIVVSLVVLILLSPLLLFIVIMIKAESKGPVFYISKRAGSGYRIFNFYKFRSMRSGAENEIEEFAHFNQYSGNSDKEVFFKIKNDPRVTRFGSFLRRTSLDEIPQFINVLLGDMSLVGNRPLPLYEAEKLTNNKIAWRFLAPAGITGLWQITKRGKDKMSSEERIALDMEYAMNRSFLLDMKILFSTLPALLQKEEV